MLKHLVSVKVYQFMDMLVESLYQLLMPLLITCESLGTGLESPKFSDWLLKYKTSILIIILYF